jgi:hypothetical protein
MSGLASFQCHLVDTNPAIPPEWDGTISDTVVADFPITVIVKLNGVVVKTVVLTDPSKSNFVITGITEGDLQVLITSANPTFPQPALGGGITIGTPIETPQGQRLFHTVLIDLTPTPGQ